MQFQLEFDIPPLVPPIQYGQKIWCIGSCFAEEIGGLMAKYKFDIITNPAGILYNPISIAQTIIDCLEGRMISQNDLFEHQHLWHNWDHHGSFSDTNIDKVLQQINASYQKAAIQLKDANWLIITLGSAFVYRLKENGKIVANCHKVPSQNFDKILLKPEEIIAALDQCLHRLLQGKPQLNIIFTVSPVRYIRDGLVASNRSKAILLYAVHQLVTKFQNLHYFPAYELVMDELRDYRFFKEDLVHPNAIAIQYVWERFTDACLDNNSKLILNKVEDIVQAVDHRPLHPETPGHQQFLKTYFQKTKQLQEEYPFFDLQQEMNYFSSSAI